MKIYVDTTDNDIKIVKRDNNVPKWFFFVNRIGNCFQYKPKKVFDEREQLFYEQVIEKFKDEVSHVYLSRRIESYGATESIKFWKMLSEPEYNLRFREKYYWLSYMGEPKSPFEIVKYWKDLGVIFVDRFNE